MPDLRNKICKRGADLIFPRTALERIRLGGADREGEKEFSLSERGGDVKRGGQKCSQLRTTLKEPYSRKK